MTCKSTSVAVSILLFAACEGLNGDLNARDSEDSIQISPQVISPSVIFEYIGFTYDPKKLVGNRCDQPGDANTLPSANWHFRVSQVPSKSYFPKILRGPQDAFWANPGTATPRCANHCDSSLHWPMNVRRSTATNGTYKW